MRRAFAPASSARGTGSPLSRKPIGKSQRERYMNVSDVEKLFVAKLQEKYRLTEPDIQRAFNKFDLDGSGYLSCEELSIAIGQYLNGIDAGLVRELVQHYDTDNDGEISLKEFTRILMSHAARNADQVLSVDHLISTRERERSIELQQDYSFSRPEDPDDFSGRPSSSSSIENEAKVFLRNLRTLLLKYALSLRAKGQIPWDERLGHHTRELAEDQAKRTLRKLFFLQIGAKRKAYADYEAFMKILKKFLVPGSAPPKAQLLNYIFRSCMTPESGDEADPELLISLMFDKDVEQENQFGFRIAPAQSATNTNRPDLGKGPFRKVGGEKPLAITDIPHRFTTRHCRAALVAPANFSSHLVDRSNTLPPYRAVRDHVYGLNLDLYSGNRLHTVGDSGVVAYASAALVVVHDVNSNEQQHFDGHTDDITCLTVSDDLSLLASGQMGHTPELLVWDLTCIESGWVDNYIATGADANEYPRGLVARLGKGFFERGVCCVQFSFDNKYIMAAGCDNNHTMGIWSLSSGALTISAGCGNGLPPQIRGMAWAPCMQMGEYVSKDHDDDECDIMCTVGERHLKFWSFKRPVNGNVNTARLSNRMGRMSTNITEPQPKIYTCVAFLSSRVQKVGASRRGHVVALDRSKRPAAGSFASNARGPPKTTAGPEGEQTELCDIVTGGSNGVVYLWRQGLCINTLKIVQGEEDQNISVDCIRVLQNHGSGNDLIFCGGGCGTMKIIDANSFAVVASYSAMPVPKNAPVAESRLTSADKLGFGAPAPPVPPRVAARPQTTKAKPTALTARPRAASAGAGRRPTGAVGAGAVGAGRQRLGAASNDSQAAGAPSEKYSIRRRAIGAHAPADLWNGPKEEEVREPPEGVFGRSNVMGLTLLYGAGGLGGAISGVGVTSVIAATGLGRVVRFDLVQRDSNRGGGGDRRSGRRRESDEQFEPLFVFHYGTLWGACTDDRSRGPPGARSTTLGVRGGTNFFVTGGDDKWLCVWDCRKKGLVIRSKTPSPIRCCDMYSYAFHFSHSGDGQSSATSLSDYVKTPAQHVFMEACIAVGMTKGAIAIYLLAAEKRRGEGSAVDYSLKQIAIRRDAGSEISDVKYSANGKMLAVGSHDQCIYIYHHKFAPSTGEEAASLDLKYLRRLRGHSSYITHLDWSADNRILRSNCGAYELLYWDVAKGQHIMSSADLIDANLVWHTETCVLGFNVMGIWYPDTDGTDVNACDVNKYMKLCATADDFGQLNVFNYPCVAKNAPGLRLQGHSSHVMCCRWLYTQRPASDSDTPSYGERDGQRASASSPADLVTVGGKDKAAIAWRLVPNYRTKANTSP